MLYNFGWSIGRSPGGLKPKWLGLLPFALNYESPLETIVIYQIQDSKYDKNRELGRAAEVYGKLNGMIKEPEQKWDIQTKP